MLAAHTPLAHKTRNFVASGGTPRGFSGNDTCFPLFCLHATYEHVSFSHGYRERFRGNSPVLVKYPTETRHFENDTFGNLHKGSAERGFPDLF